MPESYRGQDSAAHYFSQLVTLSKLLSQITHRDAVEPPLTEWPREAYDLEGATATITKKAQKARLPKVSKNFL